MKPNIWIFSIEPIDTRYTAQWASHVPALLKDNLSHKFNIYQVDGVQKNSETTPGAFLNFSDTNYWKSAQLCNFLEYFNEKKVTTNDHFLFTDFWNPVIIQLKYMKELLGLNWVFHGLAHAGSYDPADFLGRLIGDSPWVRHAEKSMYHSFDYLYFASDFHINLFEKELLKFEPIDSEKIIRTGWPMEYLPEVLNTYKSKPKRNLILFPHRVAPEKQVEIFRDLAVKLPCYEFVVCQDHKLTKDEYHTLLSEAKLVFSANLQETLGISCYEGSLVGAIPLVPNRLSYVEMYPSVFKYPSAWTENFESYKQHKDKLSNLITHMMENYNSYVPYINKTSEFLKDEYFSSKNMLEIFSKY